MIRNIAPDGSDPGFDQSGQDHTTRAQALIRENKATKHENSQKDDRNQIRGQTVRGQLSTQIHKNSQKDDRCNTEPETIKMIECAFYPRKARQDQ